MAEIAFDTMAAVRRLRDTGLEERQAEAITATVRDGITGGVATKSDIDTLRTATKADFNTFRTTTKADFNTFRTTTKADFNTFRTTTKADFNTFRAATKSDIDAFRAEIWAEIAGLKTEIRWIKLIGGTILAAVIAGSGFLYSEIRTNRDNISNLMEGQAEIKAILNERLPRE